MRKRSKTRLLNRSRRRRAGGSERSRPNRSVSKLVSAAQAGDRQAFGELYTRYAARVYAVAVSHVPVDQAADIVQEVFLRALRRLKALRNAVAFGAWITAIARNAIRDVEREGRARVDVEPEPAMRETQHEEMDAQAALQAIRGLPVAYRHTVMMRLLQGMTGPEIAHRTGLSAASVRVNLHRGMKLLRERLTAPARTRERLQHRHDLRSHRSPAAHR